MNHINNHQSAGPNLYPLYYLRTKQLQKKIELSLESLTQSYQSALIRTKQSTDSIMEEIKAREEKVMGELDALKDALIAVIDEKWADFKSFSRLLRKICLGEESERQFPTFDMQQLESLVHQITQQLSNFQEIVDAYSQSCKEISTHLHEPEVKEAKPKIKKQIVKNMFSEISPIKNKEENYNESQLRLKQFGTVNELVEVMDGKSPERKFKTEMTSNEKVQPNFEKAFGLMKEELKKSLSAKGIQEKNKLEPDLVYSVSISKTKRAAPTFPNYQSIQPLQSPKYQPETGRLKKFSNAKLNFHEMNQPRMVSPRTNSKRSRNLLDFSSRPAKINEVSATSVIYGNCLQRLQKQQLQYQRVKRGLS